MSRWRPSDVMPVSTGLLAGGLWGLLTAAAATPREWLVLDRGLNQVYVYLTPASTPQIVPAAEFYQQFNSLLIEATLLFLALAGAAGWATWQFTRLRPPGQPQRSLKEGLDWYLIGLAVGGLATVLIFRSLGWAAWFKGDEQTLIGWSNAAVGMALPLYAGGAVFLVWLRRLPSIRAPGWDKRSFRPAGRSWSWFRKHKGGDSHNHP